MPFGNTIASRVREEVTAQGLDEAQLIENGALVVDEKDPSTLLRLLNEDLFIGGLSDTPYAADRKRVR